MAWFPTGTANAGSIDDWLSAITVRLQELLGNDGTQAVLCKALADARRICPELSVVAIKQNGLDLSALYPEPSSVDAESALEREPLSVLGECLQQLLLNLLGEELTSQIFPSADMGGAEQAANPFQSKFLDPVRKASNWYQTGTPPFWERG